MKISADLVIMDWGIGGLSVYNEVRQLLPNLSILYYSDSGITPYGKMSAKELEQRLLDLVNEFSKQGVKHFIIACNAASTALPRLEKKFKKLNVHVTGVIDRGVELIRASNFKNVGVIGGRRTILAKSYTKPFMKDRQRKVRGRVAQPLSALIEAGQLDTPLLKSTLVEILAPLKKCDAIVLACTHYPAISSQIQNLLPKAKLLDPAKSTAKFVKKNWKWPRKNNGRPQQIFMTSGNALQMKKAAMLAFNVKISKVIPAITSAV